MALMLVSPCGAAPLSGRRVFVCTTATGVWNPALPCIRGPRSRILPPRDSEGHRRGERMSSYGRNSSLVVVTVLVFCSLALAQGGARIDKPFKRQVTGAQCYGG